MKIKILDLQIQDIILSDQEDENDDMTVFDNYEGGDDLMMYIWNEL